MTAIYPTHTSSAINDRSAADSRPTDAVESNAADNNSATDSFSSFSAGSLESSTAQLSPTVDKSELIRELQAAFEPVFRDIAASAADREQQRLFDREIIQRLKDAGFTRLRVPTEFGGFGLSLEETFPFFIALAEADSNIAQGLRPHFLSVESLLHSSQSDQRSHWLQRIGSGEIAIGNALTEINNKAGEVTTTIRPDGDGWILNGTKFYSTGSLYSDVIYVRAEISEGPRAGEGVFVYVDRDAKGVTLVDDWTGFGQQLSASGTTYFDNVSVGALDVVERDYTKPGLNQAFAQGHHLATLTGIAGSIENDFADYVRNRRRVFTNGPGQLPREDPLVQQVIGKVSAKKFAVTAIINEFIRQLDVASLIVRHNLGDTSRDLPPARAEEKDKDIDRVLADIDLASFRAQLTIAPLVLEAATEAFEVGGASATTKERGLDRHWRNARVLASHNPLIYRAALVGADVLNGTHKAVQYQVGTV